MTKRRIAKQATAFLLIAVILVTMAILPQTTELVIPQAQAFAQAIPFMIGAGILLIGLYLVACQGMTFDNVKDMRVASGYVWDNMTNDQRDIWMSSIEGQLLLSGMSLVDAIKNGISGEEIDMRSLIKKFVLSLGITETAWDAFVKNLFAIQSTAAAFTMPASAYVPSVIPRYTGDMSKVYEAMKTMPKPEGYIGYMVFALKNYASQAEAASLKLIWVTSSPYLLNHDPAKTYNYIRIEAPNHTSSYEFKYGNWYMQTANTTNYDQVYFDTSLFCVGTVPILDSNGGIDTWENGATNERPAVLPSIPLDKPTTIDWTDVDKIDKPYRVKLPTTFDGVVAPPSTLVIPTPPKELTIDDFIAELTDHIAAIGDVLAPPRDQADYREIMEKMRRYMEHINKRARDGAVTGSLLGQLADILARLRQALQRLRQNGLTDDAVNEYVGTLNPAVTITGELAKALGFEETEQPPPDDSLLDKLFGSVTKAIDNLGNFLINGLKSLFVPNPNFFSDGSMWRGLVVAWEDKFEFINNFKRVFDNLGSNGGPLKITVVKIMGHDFEINLKWYEPFRTYIRSGIAVIFVIAMGLGCFRMISGVFNISVGVESKNIYLESHPELRKGGKRK